VTLLHDVEGLDGNQGRERLITGDAKESAHVYSLLLYAGLKEGLVLVNAKPKACQVFLAGVAEKARAVAGCRRLIIMSKMILLCPDRRMPDRLIPILGVSVSAA